MFSYINSNRHPLTIKFPIINLKYNLIYNKISKIIRTRQQKSPTPTLKTNS